MNEADQHLLALIRAGSEEAWSRFVARFHARLIAFAARKVGQFATAEDLVQDTFVGFLQSLEDFRQQCELESFLFQILRRRIVDHYRRVGRRLELPCCEFRFGKAGDEATDPLQNASGNELSPSQYARRGEEAERDRSALALAIEQWADEVHASQNFRDLKIAEGLFYAQRRSVELAQALGTSENEIAVIKRRLIARLAKAVSQAAGFQASSDEPRLAMDLLSAVWESHRPSCPKRTTLGKYTLGILPSPWTEFICFHVETIGCTFCNANLADLQAPESSFEASTRHARLFTSIVGFFHRSQSAGRG